MKKTITKKIIAMLLATAIVVTYFPAMAFAEGEGEQPAPESGQYVQEPEEEPEEEPEKEVPEEEVTSDDVQSEQPEEADDVQPEQSEGTNNKIVLRGANRGAGDAIQVSSWDDLYEACINAPDNESTDIMLSDNITRNSKSDYDRIEINDKKIIVIDLNGKTLDADRKSFGKTYHVLDVHSGGDLTVIDSSNNEGVIKGGYAGQGGGIYISEKATCTIEGGTITKNGALSDGGGIYADGTLIMTGGIVSANHANAGGGILLSDKATDISLANVTISDNRSGLNGAGIDTHAAMIIENCSIKGNENTDDHSGGGIYVSATGKTVEINNTTIAKNKAKDDGGGIRVHTGTVKMTGGSITECSVNRDGGGVFVAEGAAFEATGTVINKNISEGAGGGLYISGGSEVTLTNVVIDSNESKDGSNGGGIDTHAPITIDSCSITNNKSDDNGGGLYVDTKGNTVTVTNTIFKDNFADDDGGGIYIERGTVKMTGGSVTGCYGDDGGGVYVTSDTNFIADGVTISENKATKLNDEDHGDAGGICCRGTMTLTGCEVSYNTATNRAGGIWLNSEGEASLIKDTKIRNNKAEGSSGGGIHQEKGLLVFENSTVTDNTAYGCGGGIYKSKKDRSRLNLTDTEVTGNSASVGGGIYFEDTARENEAMIVGGNTVVSDNLGSDVYLPGKMLIQPSGNNKLGSGANIGITHPRGAGAFTMFFERNMGEGETADTYFFSNDNYLVTMQDGNGYLMLDLDEAHKFLKMAERINTNVNRLGPSNWMSGVSGERYLNEINMPGTHDTSMFNVSSKGCLSGDYGAKQATTQKEFYFEQLNNGARFFDIRMKNYYCHKEKSVLLIGLAGAAAGGVVCCIPGIGQLAGPLILAATGAAIYNNSRLPEYKDDGENLWTCHGRSIMGTFYALDKNDDRLSFAMELEYFKEFLRNHPTETIIIDARAETDEPGGEEYYEVMERLNGVMEELSKETNPSTGESYVYWEDGKVGKKFTHWPQLKDCRGKIVLWGKLELTADTIGGIWMNSDGIEVQKPEGTYKDGAYRGTNLMWFIRTHNKLRIPRDAMNGQMKEFYWIEMNTTDTAFIKTPVELAEESTLPVVFGKDGLVNETKKGRYFGWFGIDAGRAMDFRDVWITNFPDDLDYCTITVKSGQTGENAPKDQVYKVLRGSTITIPGCIYDGDQADYFEGWKENIDNKVYIKNNKYRVLENVTFTAQWANDLQTPVTVVWKDADDLDGIRPTELTIRYNTDYTEPVTAGGDWTIMLSCDLEGDPAVDVVPKDYTAKVEGKKGKDGYIITMTHTPDVKVNASGTVTWKDNDDKDGIRPGSVTLHLYANGKEVKSGTATANGGWKFDLGTYPRYEDGELVAYKLIEDEITFDETKTSSGYTNGVKAIDGEKNAITGFEVTNTHDVTTSVMYANIEWDDDDNAAGERPESVKVQWLKDGKPYGNPIVVKPNEDGDWYTSLELTFAEMQEIGKEQDAIAEKYQAGEMTEEEFIEAIESTIRFTVRQDKVKKYNTTVMLKEEPGSGEEKGVVYFEILNTYGSHEHELTKTNAKAATCTEDGNTAYWTCDQGDKPCGKYFSDADGMYEIEKDSWIIPALGHNWGPWKVTKKPTTLNKGQRQRVCRNDPSHVQKQTIPAIGTSGVLIAKMTTKGKKGLKIKWNELEGAEGYDVFFTKCDTAKKIYKFKKVKTVKAGSELSWTKTGLKKGIAHKAYVKAWAMKDGKKVYVARSLTVHGFTGGCNKVYTNPKKVVLKSKKSVTLKAGKTAEIKAKVRKLKKNRKLISKEHERKLRYLSSDNKIATVSKSGRITAKSKGSCKVYVITVNGVYKTVKVTVK